MKDGQVLLVIDMQHGLLQREIFNKQALIENVNSLLDCFHSENRPVFLIRHANSSFLKANSDEWQIYNKLNVTDTDILIDKSHSSVFKEREFLSSLRDKDAKSVIIVGLVSNGCVQAACLDAKKNGYSVILIRDAHSTFHKDAANVIMDWNMRLKNEGVELLSTNEFITVD